MTMATTTTPQPVPRVVPPQPIGYGNLMSYTGGQMQPDPFGGRFGNNPGLLSYLIASNQPQWGNPSVPAAPGTPTTPVTPAPTPAPTPTPGTGGTGTGTWTGQPSGPTNGITYRNDNHGGGGGQFGGGNQQAAYDASQRNLATNPSLADSALFGSSFAGPMGILGLMGQLGLSQFGIGSNPFNINGDMTLSPSQQAMISSALQGIPENAPAVVKANMLNSAIAAARNASNAGYGSPGSIGINGGILGGYNSAGNRGPAGAASVGGGDRGAGTQGSPGGSPGGGLGGGYRL